MAEKCWTEGGNRGVHNSNESEKLSFKKEAAKNTNT